MTFNTLYYISYVKFLFDGVIHMQYAINITFLMYAMLYFAFCITIRFLTNYCHLIKNVAYILIYHMWLINNILTLKPFGWYELNKFYKVGYA